MNNSNAYREFARTSMMVWERELIRYYRNRIRIFTGLSQPILYLFVLGYGMGNLIGVTGGFDFKKFVFPGVVAMSVVSTTIFSAISIVWDREFGFLREMLVAPVRRSAIVTGKVFGGATVATAQGTIMLIFAPLIGVHLTVLLVVQVIAIEFVMALSLTALGVFAASRIEKIEGFQVVMQLVLLPMIFLSGATFPLEGLPAWLSVMTRINPLTYAVAPLRSVIFGAQNMPPLAAARFPTTIEIFGHALSNAVDLGLIAAFMALFFGLAVRGFSLASK